MIIAYVGLERYVRDSTETVIIELKKRRITSWSKEVNEEKEDGN